MMPITFPAVLMIIATLLGVSDTIVAQSISDSAKLNLEEVVISGSKFAEKKKYHPEDRHHQYIVHSKSKRSEYRRSSSLNRKCICPEKSTGRK